MKIRGGMKVRGGSLPYNFIAYLFVLILVLTCIGLYISHDKSKNDEAKKDDETPSSVTSERDTESIRQEDENLKKALAKAPEEKSDEAKKDDETHSSVTSERDLDRLRQEIENLKKALAKANEALSSTTPERDLESIRQEDEKKISSESSNDKKEQRIIPYEGKSAVDRIIAGFNSATDSERKIELIESLGQLSFGQDPRVVSVIEEALTDADPEVGRAAMGLLKDYKTIEDEIFSVAEQALESQDEQIRIEALESISGANNSDAAALLAQSLNDPSQNVRATALEMVEELTDDLKLEIMEKGIYSPHEEVKYAVASMLEDKHDHSAVEILIEGLKDSDPDFVEEVNLSLDFMIDREFTSYDEAKTWWNKNKNNYDVELFLKEDK